MTLLRGDRVSRDSGVMLGERYQRAWLQPLVSWDIQVALSLLPDNTLTGLTRWYNSAIPALGRWRWGEFEVLLSSQLRTNLGYVCGGPCLKE